MTKSKTTKRALFMSVLSMLLCVSMLVGSTFAWFTDSVTTGINKIVAGNLDVELYHSNGTVTDEQVGAETKLFVNKDGSAIQWEPGVMVYENFTVKNIGSLAVKYKLTLNAECNTVDGKALVNVLKVAILDHAFDGDRATAQALTFDKTVADFEKPGKLKADEAGKAGDTYAVVIYWMPSDKDNDYNFNNDRKDLERLYADFSISLIATQDTVESDSFDERYDKGAWDDINIYPNGDGTYSDGENTYVEVDNKYVKVIADETIEGLYRAENGDKYTTTASAFTAAANAGGNITALADIEEEFKNTTLELDGTTYPIDNKDLFLNITADTNIGFDDNTVTINSESGQNGIKVNKDATLTLSNGTIEQSKAYGTSKGVVYTDKGTVVLNDMTIINSTKSGVTVSAGSDGGVFEIYGSTIEGGTTVGSPTVFCGSQSYVLIEGSTVIGRIQAANNGLIEINGGDYTQATFDSQYKEHIIIYNGLFNFDPSDSTEVMLAGDTTYVTDNGNGTWSVATVDEGYFEDPFGD